MTTPPQDNQNHPLYQQAKDAHKMPVEGQPRKQPQRPPEDRAYLAYALIAINLLIFVGGYLSQNIQAQLFIEGSLFPPAVVEGNQFYRLFTVMFLHGSPMHIFFNMYALYIVGNMIEPIFGRLRFGIIYFLGGLGGSVLSLALGDYGVPSVGASGAVFAIFTAEAVHLYQHRNIYRNVKGQLRQILFLIGFNVLIGFTPGSNIDNWGHIGGLIGGAILAWRIAPRIERPTTPVAIKSMSDLAKFDSNPFVNHFPFVVIYVMGLIGILAVAINFLAP
jgi:rhomboid protease GluP